MPNVPIIVDGRQYNLACDRGQEEKLALLAKDMDRRAAEIRRAVPQINENTLLVMVGILAYDEIYNLRNGANLTFQNSPEFLQIQEKASNIAERIDALANSL